MQQKRKMNEERRDEVSESLTKETRNWMENAIVDNVRPRLPTTDSKRHNSRFWVAQGDNCPPTSLNFAESAPNLPRTLEQIPLKLQLIRIRSSASGRVQETRVQLPRNPKRFYFRV